MATIKEILSTDIIKNSRQDINDNFQALNNELTTKANQSTTYTKTETNNLLATKQNILSEWAFVNWDKTKLDWIQAGAQVNTINAWDNISQLNNNVWYVTNWWLVWTKQVDETNIWDTKILVYNTTSWKLEYQDNTSWWGWMDVFSDILVISIPNWTWNFTLSHSLWKIPSFILFSSNLILWWSNTASEWSGRYNVTTDSNDCIQRTWTQPPTIHNDRCIAYWTSWTTIRVYLSNVTATDFVVNYENSAGFTRYVYTRVDFIW